MIDFDLGGVTPDGVEAFEKTGGLLPDGWHHCRLDGSKDTSANSGSTGTELEFTVVSGPCVGQTITETLWNSDKQGAKNRIALFASKLGLIVRDGAKFVAVKGKETFSDCHGVKT